MANKQNYRIELRKSFIGNKRDFLEELLDIRN